jgi:hypothetical protein
MCTSNNMKHKCSGALEDQAKLDKDFHPRENEQTAQERWIKDVLEDDDVREALRSLRRSGKDSSGRQT